MAIGRASRNAVFGVAMALCLGGSAEAATYYVRQTVGDDASDGLSPETAWQSLSKLAPAMHAGDVAYVGPGLYREQVDVQNEGTPDHRITFIADSDGSHTGDPPGVVMVAGSETVDASIFTAGPQPGVYTADFPGFLVWGVVEMDGDQSRYLRVTITDEYINKKMPPADIVAAKRSSFYYDETAKRLVLHTSDDQPPARHELELMRRFGGITMTGKRYVTVIGFTFRHMHDSGIEFFRGADGGVAIDNVSYGGRQGIRVLESSGVLVYGNTLFRNENCGVYFLSKSNAGRAIGNISFENVKGIRWGSHSEDGVAIGNTLFDNLERGLSVEEVDQLVARDNRLMGNHTSQLLALGSDPLSGGNCFATDGKDQRAADLSLYPWQDHFKTLAEYQRAKHRELDSREGSCGSSPVKPDVHALHAESQGYLQRARAALAHPSAENAAPVPPPDAKRSPLGRFWGWITGPFRR